MIASLFSIWFLADSTFLDLDYSNLYKQYQVEVFFKEKSYVKVEELMCILWILNGKKENVQKMLSEIIKSQNIKSVFIFDRLLKMNTQINEKRNNESKILKIEYGIQLKRVWNIPGLIFLSTSGNLESVSRYYQILNTFMGLSFSKSKGIHLKVKKSLPKYILN